MKNIKEYDILRVKGDRVSKDEDIVIREYNFTIFINNENITTLLCSPNSLKSLAIGYLYSEGYINSISDIDKIEIDEERDRIYVDLHNMLKEKIPLQYERIEGNPKVEIEKIRELVDQFNKSSKLFTDTGGVHSCALCSLDKIIIFKEDIGRHNAMDKVFGQALIEKIDMKDKVVLTSGRISTEILIKVARRKIPIIVSISATTNLAIDMAKKLNITLIGFVRGRRMNIYSGFQSLNI